MTPELLSAFGAGICVGAIAGFALCHLLARPAIKAWENAYKSSRDNANRWREIAWKEMANANRDH